jgi:hypothetical protein
LLDPEVVAALRDDPAYLADALAHADDRLRVRIECRVNELNG